MKYLYYGVALLLLTGGIVPGSGDLQRQLFLSGLGICVMLMGVIDAIERGRRP